jgi:MoaA/NifB/PqqE/SkfB family radical SAM enzyme
MNNQPADLLNIVSKLTPGRFLNILKVLSGYFVSRFSGKVYVWGFPVSISVEPTTSCNLRCPECISGLRSFTRPTGMLDENFFKNLADQIEKNVLYMIFYFQGEPFLNPSFLSMIEYASSKKIYTATSTNAHFLDSETAKKTVESGLDRLIVSIDGTTQETYSKYRIGGSLEKVLQGASNILEWKKKLKSKKPYVVFQFLVVSYNEHQVEEAKQLSREYGADKIVFKTAQINDFENGSSLIPSEKKFSRYKETENGKYTIKNKLFNHCWRIWHSSVITWDGKVVPCCFDKDARHQTGDLNHVSFKKIWKGDLYRGFRQSVLNSRKDSLFENNYAC